MRGYGPTYTADRLDADVVDNVTHWLEQNGYAVAAKQFPHWASIHTLSNALRMALTHIERESARRVAVPSSDTKGEG